MNIGTWNYSSRLVYYGVKVKTISLQIVKKGEFPIAFFPETKSYLIIGAKPPKHPFYSFTERKKEEIHITKTGFREYLKFFWRISITVLLEAVFVITLLVCCTCLYLLMMKKKNHITSLVTYLLSYSDHFYFAFRISSIWSLQINSSLSRTYTEATLVFAFYRSSWLEDQPPPPPLLPVRLPRL